jgi:RHS repeat-associated protein
VENRLRSVTGGPSSVTLDYDAFGRLGTVTTGGAATHYRYAGAQLAAESSGGVLLRSHVSGQGVDEQWMSVEGTGAAATPTWYLQDRQSSVIGVSDASGAITPYAYGPYGEPQSWSGSRFRYTGQIAIPEAQLYHYRARAYDPVMGRFLQTDPIGYDDGPQHIRLRRRGSSEWDRSEWARSDHRLPRRSWTGCLSLRHGLDRRSRNQRQCFCHVFLRTAEPLSMRDSLYRELWRPAAVHKQCEPRRHVGRPQRFQHWRRAVVFGSLR